MIANKGNAVASVLSNYCKRILENYYNRLGETAFFESLKHQDSSVKMAIEGGMYAFTAYLDQRVTRDTVLKKALMEIFTDMAPELAKRIINGAKEEIKSCAQSSEEIDLASAILELSDENLKNLLKWLFETDPTERTKLLDQMGKMAIEEQLRLIQLPQDQVKQYIAVFGKQLRETKTTLTEILKPDQPVQKEAPPNSINVLREKIHQKRLRLQANRKRRILW